MANDPELYAMSQVFDALQNLDESTRMRVIEWVLAKLQSQGEVRSTVGAKRGPKPGANYRKRGRKAGRPTSSNLGAKRGPKPGARKRMPGRPKGSKSKSTSN